MGKFKACLDGGRGMEAVKRDIEQAQKIGVRSTPTYVINGILTTGVIPPAMFDEFLHALRERGS
jgi:protein-disulfide isomerase